VYWRGKGGNSFDRWDGCNRVDVMTMKPLYYVVLVRPQGSKTWTPAGDDWAGGSNFFTSEEKARAEVEALNGLKAETWLEGAQEWVRWEHAVGQVTACGQA
jgi:hypothetical protein